MTIRVKRSIYVMSVLSLLGVPSPLLSNELDLIPPPASGHSTTDAELLQALGLSTITAAAPSESQRTKALHSETANKEESPLPLKSQKAIENVVTAPVKKAPVEKESDVNPYQLEKTYGIRTTVKKQVKTTPQKTVVAQRTKPVSPSVKTVTESDYNPLVDEEGSWQASAYRFSPELNKLKYPSDSPLKMITMQLMVEISSGGKISKAKELLHKINKALPNAVLIAGLRELHTKEEVYPLAQWNRDDYTKAIQKVKSRRQNNTIGYGLQEIRPSLLNIPYPLSLLLITDGEHENIETLAFDTKIFYAPDPRSPLHIVSFATTKEEKESIRVLQRVHHGTYVFDGFKLLQDEGAFTAFMKSLFVK